MNDTKRNEAEAPRLLSKWWQTESAKAAFARVETKKAASVAKMKERFQSIKAARAARIADLDRQIWEGVTH